MTTNLSSPVIRNSAGLRNVIFDELDALRAGTSNPTRANAVAKLASGVVETVRMEVEVHKLRVTQGKGADEVNPLGAPLELGGTAAVAA